MNNFKSFRIKLNNKGALPLVALLLVAVIVVGGGLYWLIARSSTSSSNNTTTNVVEPTDTPRQSLSYEFKHFDQIKVPSTFPELSNKKVTRKWLGYDDQGRKITTMLYDNTALEYESGQSIVERYRNDLEMVGWAIDSSSYNICPETSEIVCLEWGILSASNDSVAIDLNTNSPYGLMIQYISSESVNPKVLLPSDFPEELLGDSKIIQVSSEIFQDKNRYHIRLQNNLSQVDYYSVWQNYSWDEKCGLGSGPAGFVSFGCSKGDDSVFVRITSEPNHPLDVKFFEYVFTN